MQQNGLSGACVHCYQQFVTLPAGCEQQVE